MTEKPKRLLRDAMPHELQGCEYEKSRSQKMLDVEVVAEYGHGEPDGWKQWPGPHKHVCKWVALANGYAVAWNENVSHGWSFPVVKLNA